MRPVFIERGPALLVENRERVLVLADLHFGIESHLASRGVHIGSGSGERLERALACIDETDPDLLLLLGDVKHNIPLTTRQEYRELPGIMDSLRRRVPVRVIPGNHDGGLARFLEEGELLPMRGAVIDGTGYLHGHTLPA
ncbi:MAG: metallophosphoesterase, partial [Methanomicrobiaceae archaeon]|nr:metallophosphoesterase [Methanomicrobiaceae archaeon]